MTTETDAATLRAIDIEGGGEFDAVHVAKRMEHELNELNGYLCRIKLPLPVIFIAQLADIFPGKRIRMTEKSGYLCIFDSQND